MPKKLTAALLSLLVAASTLAVVASPVAAHNQTKTVRRCAYDPFAGNQCWNQTVSVSHTHSCGAGMIGSYPNCYPAPSTNRQNAGDEEVKDRAEEARKKADPKPKTKQPDPEPEEPESEPEPEIKEPEEPEEPAEDPEPEPELEIEEPEEPAEDPEPAPEIAQPDGNDSDTGNNIGVAYTVKPCTSYQNPLETVQRHRHPLGDSSTVSACHRHDNSHCPAGHTERGGHGSQNCRRHDAVDNFVTRIQHLIEQGTVTSLDAARDAINKALTDLGEDALRNAEMNQHLGQELLDLYNSLPAPVRITGTYLFCVGLAAAAVKAAPVTGGSSAAWFVTHAAGLGCTLGIEYYIPKHFGGDGDGSDSGTEKGGEGQNRNHDQNQGDGSNQNHDGDSGDSSGSGGGDSQGPVPTTAPPASDPVPENPTRRQYLDEFERYNKAVRNHGKGLISDAERTAAADRFQQVLCNRGKTTYCK